MKPVLGLVQINSELSNDLSIFAENIDVAPASKSLRLLTWPFNGDIHGNTLSCMIAGI